MKDKIKAWLENKAPEFSDILRSDDTFEDLTGFIHDCFQDIGPKPMFDSLEDYEQAVGFQVNDAFKAGFNMARLKMAIDEGDDK